MKNIFVFILLLISVSLCAGNWEKSGDFSMLLSQSYYSDNWEGSEKGNINWTASFNFIMQKQLSKILHDKNTLLMSFGQSHTQDYDQNQELVWKKPEISTDKIDYENLLTFTLQKFVDPFVSLRWESSFYDASVPDDTYYLNPNILTLSAGAKKVIIDQEKQNLESRLGAAFKNYLNQNSDIDNYNNAGAELVVAYWLLFPSELGKFDSTLRLYQALATSEDSDTDDWEATDMEFISNLSFKLNSYIGFKLYYEMLYDKEIIDEVRYQENLGINLSYTLF